MHLTKYLDRHIHGSANVGNGIHTITIVWDLRSRWQDILPSLRKTLLAGEYSFGPLSEIKMTEESIRSWSAQDALVLKAISIGLATLPVFGECNSYHLAGRGGSKKAIRDVCANLTSDAHVMKSDVKSFYASINHHILYNLLEQHLTDKFVLRLLWQYMRRTICYGGLYRQVTQGISLRCSLSPLMGALYLKPLDDCLRETGLCYALYMDDWVVLAPTRWKIRNVVQMVNKVLNELQITKHPDKTFIGRVSRGFDFLGYFLHPENIRVSLKSSKKFVERIGRLYEQNADSARIGQYVLRWMSWACSGVPSHFKNLLVPASGACHFPILRGKNLRV